MERPRLSICSSSDSSDDSVSSARVLDSPSTLPPVVVDSLVVNNGGTGVVHGNITSYTVNQYLVPDLDNWDPVVVRDLVVDAVKINSDTNNKFFPHNTLSSPQLPGKKEDLEGLQKKWCYLIAALVLLSFITLLSSSVFSLTSIRSISSQQTYPSTQPPEDNPSNKECRQNKWFYFIAGLVALSCILCIVPPVLFTLTSVWSSGEGIPEVDGLLKGWCYVVGVLVAVSCMNFICTVIFSAIGFRNSRAQSSTLREPLSIDNLMTAPRIMGRAIWLAQPPIQPLDSNSLPVKRVIICHTATEEYLTTPECCMQTRFIQMCHIEYKKWYDIGYNFLIGGDGCVYVGRGWEKVGAHTKGHNIGSLGIAFMGTFIFKMPNPNQLEALKKLLTVGVETKKISEDYKLLAHCQLIPTASPGMTLVKNMMTWPHFDVNLPIRCSTL